MHVAFRLTCTMLCESETYAGFSVVGTRSAISLYVQPAAARVLYFHSVGDLPRYYSWFVVVTVLLGVKSLLDDY